MTSYNTNLVYYLSHSDLDRMIALQDRVIHAMPDNQKDLAPKSREAFASVLEDPEKKPIGIYNGEKLSAMAIIVEPNSDDGDPDLLDFELPDTPKQLSTLSTVMVTPELRGGTKMQDMLAFWNTHVAKNGRHHMLTLVTRTNMPSLSKFLNDGHRVVDAGEGKIERSTVYFLQKDNHTEPCRRLRERVCARPFNRKSGADAVVDGTSPLPDVQRLLRSGYEGAHLERANDNRPTGRVLLYLRRDNACQCG